MKSIALRKVIYLVLGSLTILTIAFFPQRGVLPDVETIIFHGKAELETAIRERCGKAGVVEYLNHRVGAFPSDPPDMKHYSVDYTLSVDGNTGEAGLHIWGRTNWFRIAFMGGRTKPVADILGWKLKCGSR